MTGLAVRLPSEPESAALGGALQSLALADDRPLLEALRAVDVPLVPHAIAPREEVQGAYEEALQRHLSLAVGLFG